MIKKYMLPRAFGLLFISLTVWLFVEATRPEVLPIGAKVPNLSYETSTGLKNLASGDNGNLLVMLFQRNCQYCQYELDEFDDNCGLLSGFDVKFLTFDREVLALDYSAGWVSLASAENVEWGFVDRKEFNELFGETSTPTTFIFRQNVLSKKVRGEARLEFLLN